MNRQARRAPAQGEPEGGGAASHLDGLIRHTSALAWDRRVRLALLAAGGVAMLGLLLFVGRWLLFWYDEWDFVFGRQSLTLSSVFAPHVDTLLAMLSLLYQGLLAVFGLRTYLPFLLVTWLAHFVCVVLLYRIVARRSGPVLGTMAGLSLLFLGSAYEVLLQPFQMQYLFAAAGGLLAIDRILLAERSRDAGHRPADLAVAAIALLFAVASSSLGPIMIGLIIIWALLRRDRGALVAVAPAILAYGAWYLTWGRQSQGLPGTGLDVVQSVEALLYGIGAAICGVLGLSPEHFARLGVVIGLVAVVAVALARVRPGPLALAGFSALVAEYGLQAFFRGSYGIEHAARSGYLYPAAIFLWLTISGVVGARLGEAAWRGRGRLAVVPVLIGLLIIPMVIGNMRQIVGAARASRFMRATELAELRLIEAVRDESGLALDVSPDLALIPQVTARKYLAAVDRFGAPTLGWDWSVGVDPAAVNAAAVRLLDQAIRLDAATPPATTGPVVEVTGASTAQGIDPACVLVIPNDGQASATWAADGRAIWLKHVAPDQSSFLVGVMGVPSAALEGKAKEAFLAGRPIKLPDLPTGYRWRVTLRSDTEQPFEVCATPLG